METRANFVLIGAFALAGFLGIFAFFLWFANVQLNQQFAYYDIDFDTVSGLSDASDVRFSGLPVGRVVDVGLSPEADGTVRVRVEIDASTPVRSNSVATIESQGVTGVSFVGISSGTPTSPLLLAASVDEVPMITPGQSVLQSLSENAPELLAETLDVVRDLRELIGGDNQQRVQNILENVEQSSASFAQALEDFSAVSGTVSSFAEGIDRFNTTLDSLTLEASGALASFQTTLDAIDALSADARLLIADGSTTLGQADTALATANAYILEDLRPATEQLNQSIVDFETRFAALSENATGLIATYAETGEIANERLTETREILTAANDLIARIDETMASVDVAARRFDGLITDGAEPLVTELRTATAEATAVIQKVRATADTDLAAIMEDIRTATDRAMQTIETVGSDLSSASGRLDQLSLTATDTLEQTRETFANANTTLTAINEALETGDRALEAAESAFRGADRIINEEIDGIADRLRLTLDELDATVGQVAQEIPGVAEDLRSASRSAEAAFAEIEGTVQQSAPAFREFANSALPQYGRLAVETRTLIDNLDTLVEQIRRNPSRFFIDPGAPEYRR
ncbi:MCE family protein [Marivita hallyeonensis]|uniref:Phospholipid/cholesterol/gamma-HCH transport system substrate-binding protein n=1 Tax=Marivita hallyeonensis TaxID=996342 RepID=A0A1M5MMJ4_9RHOB|nr:MlaD family protein [Marivita hallyeonensis]SHG78634.1 phospholipid/cholesterol/gamma-HCH transport system substrate-binding protein [Marivita hallyeonensis]